MGAASSIEVRLSHTDRDEVVSSVVGLLTTAAPPDADHRKRRQLGDPGPPR
ncbi:MAG TPA: hypothetical protein VFA11_00695 [Acidimicrobiales bacterium]|nr:hypothetical protein [Acidimicrobiales bacterium]